MNEWIFLVQLVRDLTNAYSRSQKCLVSVYHLAPQISEAFFVFLVAGANAIKATTLDPSELSMLCLSPYQRVFYALASWCPSQRTRDCLQTPRPKAYVQTMTPTANFWAQIIFDPYRRPLTLTFLHVSTRGLFQDTMFERLHNSTFSEDASEVLVQPLYCGTEKATSVARVVVKPTPRLCSRCASNT